MNNLFGGIEAGGTKFVCVIANNEGRILQEKTIQTASPEITLNDVCNFFTTEASIYLANISSIGIGCFGPLNLDQLSPTYGNITTTPKPGWKNFPIRKFLQKKFDIPVAIDTDVNAAALGEIYWSLGKKIENLIYLTIGTGIGGGAYVNKTLIHGLIHPEMGHMYIPHDGELDPFQGICPFHGDCFEGLASGPALAKRWGIPAEQIIQDHPAWDLEAHYIALALTNIICILSPENRIGWRGYATTKTIESY